MREEFIQHTQSQEPSTENLFRVLGWHGHETTESALRRMVLSLELSCTLSLLFWRYPLTNHGIHIYYITHNSHSSSSSYRKGNRIGGWERTKNRKSAEPAWVYSVASLERKCLGGVVQHDNFYLLSLFLFAMGNGNWLEGSTPLFPEPTPTRREEITHMFVHMLAGTITKSSKYKAKWFQTKGERTRCCCRS